MCGLRGDGGGRPGRRHPRGNRDDVWSARPPLPEGHHARKPARGPRPTAAPLVRDADGTLPRGRLAGGVRRGANACCAPCIGAARRPAPSHVYIGQSRGPQLRSRLLRRRTRRDVGRRGMQAYYLRPGTVDQWPLNVVSAVAVRRRCGTHPIPDLKRTDHIVVLGANPAVSQGSHAVGAPTSWACWPTSRTRGGRVVVVDPRRTETAARADGVGAGASGHRRAVAVRAAVRPRGDRPDPADPRTFRDGWWVSTRPCALLGAVHPRARQRRDGHRRTDDPATRRTISPPRSDR